MTSTGLDSSEVRRHNLALVLEELLLRGPRPRTDLATATGLTPGSITSLTSELIAGGLIREHEAVPRIGRGRPSITLKLSAQQLCIVTALLDPERVTAVVSDLGGERLLRVERRHGRPVGDPAAVLSMLSAVIEEALRFAEGAGRRIGDLTVVLWTPVFGTPPRAFGPIELGWRTVDVLGFLRSQSVPIANLAETLPNGIGLSGDNSMAAVAESAFFGRPDNLLYIKSDSGIGGAIVANGRPITGEHRTAAVFGHVALDPTGPVCVCGQRGCVATVAGPDVLLAAAGLDDLAAEAGATVALGRFTSDVLDGEERAVRAWRPAGDAIAHALLIMSIALDPGTIVLGGMLAPLRDDIATRYLARYPTYSIDIGVSAPSIVASSLGSEGALRGAEITASLRLIADPTTTSSLQIQDLN